MTVHLGTGPCGRCRQTNDDVLLTGQTLQARDGGTYWRVAAGVRCASCGYALEWMYEGPIVLEMPVLSMPALVSRAD